MIDERIIDKLVERLTDRIEEANVFALKEIGKTIGKIGTLTPTKARNLSNILKYGGNYDKIINELARVTELNIKDIKEIIEEVAKRDYDFAKQFYEYRNIKYIPYEENEALKRQVEAIANITAKEYFNISRTTGFSKMINGRMIHEPLAVAYQQAIDKAVISVAQGKGTYAKQMYKTIRELSNSGIKTIDYPTGYARRLDSSVNMNIRGSLRTLHNEIQSIIGKEIDADGVEISVHLNAADDHIEVQGHQFSNEEFDKFQNNKDAVDYQGRKFSATFKGHDRRSIGEYNCYHNVFSIVLGVNKPNYSDEALQQIIDNNKKGFDFEGNHYSMYEGTQLQRNIELQLRKAKDRQIMLKASYNEGLSLESKNDIKQEIANTQKRITALTKEYRDLSVASGLPTKLERARVIDYRRINVNKL